MVRSSASDKPSFKEIHDNKGCVTAALMAWPSKVPSTFLLAEGFVAWDALHDGSLSRSCGDRHEQRRWAVSQAVVLKDFLSWLRELRRRSRRSRDPLVHRLKQLIEVPQTYADKQLAPLPSYPADPPDYDDDELAEETVQAALRLAPGQSFVAPPR